MRVCVCTCVIYTYMCRCWCVHMCVCVCMCVWLHIYVQVLVHAHVCMEAQGWCQVSFSVIFSFSYWGKVCSWAQLRADWLASLVGSFPGTPCLPAPECWDSRQPLDLLSGAGDLNSSPHTCTARTPHSPSFQPLDAFLDRISSLLSLDMLPLVRT